MNGVNVSPALFCVTHVQSQGSSQVSPPGGWGQEGGAIKWDFQAYSEAIVLYKCFAVDKMELTVRIL